MIGQLDLQSALEDLADQIREQTTIAGQCHPGRFGLIDEALRRGRDQRIGRQAQHRRSDGSMPAGRSFVTELIMRSFPAHDHRPRTIRTNPGYTHPATVPSRGIPFGCERGLRDPARLGSFMVGAET